MAHLVWHVFVFLLLGASVSSTLVMRSPKGGSLTQDVSDRTKYAPEPQTNVSYKTSVPGRDVRLTCLQSGGSNPNPENTNITWFFKACGSGAGKTECEGLVGRSWQGELVCGEEAGGKTMAPCSNTLLLSRVSPTANGGLYKCYRIQAREGFVTRASLLNTYLLQIVERDVKEPEWVETPRSVEVAAGEVAVLWCKVHSLLPLKIHWFKEVLEGEEASSPAGAYRIPYMNRVYELLTSASAFKLQNNIYVSKLVLKKTTEKDSGLYVCGALSDAGIRYKEAKLQVESAPSPGKNSHLPEARTRVLISVVVFSGVIFVSCIWSVGFCYCCVARRRAHDRPLAEEQGNLRRREIHLDVIGSETSDYEHIAHI